MKFLDWVGMLRVKSFKQATEEFQRLDLDGFGGAKSKEEALAKMQELIDESNVRMDKIMEEKKARTDTVKPIEDQEAFYKAAQTNMAQADAEANPMYAVKQDYMGMASTYIAASGAGYYYTLPKGLDFSKYQYEPAPERIDPRAETKREILI